MATRRQRSNPSSPVVSVRLEPELVARLDALAERTKRSRGAYLRLALETVLPRMEKHHWEQQMMEVEQDKTEEEFRRITFDLLDEDDR